MFTAETTVDYRFDVTARVYDLSTGEDVADARAADTDKGYYGVMLVVYPFCSAPNERQYLESMGRAIGEELGRRFRFSQSTGLNYLRRLPRNRLQLW
jgi:hypothetical protein